jgi:hypothetical protein
LVHVLWRVIEFTVKSSQVISHVNVELLSWHSRDCPCSHHYDADVMAVVFTWFTHKTSKTICLSWAVWKLIVHSFPHSHK